MSPPMTVMKAEAKQALADAKWWRNMLPIGWRLYGFNGRDNAAVIGPNDHFVEIDGIFMIALFKKVPNVETSPDKTQNQLEVLHHHGVKIPEIWKSCDV